MLNIHLRQSIEASLCTMLAVFGTIVAIFITILWLKRYIEDSAYRGFKEIPGWPLLGHIPYFWKFNHDAAMVNIAKDVMGGSDSFVYRNIITGKISHLFPLKLKLKVIKAYCRISQRFIFIQFGHLCIVVVSSLHCILERISSYSDVDALYQVEDLNWLQNLLKVFVLSSDNI